MNKAQFKHLITALWNSAAGMSIAIMPTRPVTADITHKEYEIFLNGKTNEMDWWKKGMLDAFFPLSEYFNK